MSDIKSVLSLLCQHLNSSINVAIKTEYFRLAKFNSPAENVSEAFWRALNVLSYHAVKEKQIEIDFQGYDIIWATKLYFAYLQYPAIEFYALSEQCKNNRPLLLAFAWILGTQNILGVVTQLNLSSSVLGKECSSSSSVEKRETETEYSVPETLTSQINHVLCLNGKLNYNVKEISELVCERSKLASKVHAASADVNGLPHLSISEAALIKRISSTSRDAVLSKEDKKHIKELSSIANLLDVHMKWLKKEHIFFEWMVTVIEEHNTWLSSNSEDINWDEVSRFICLLNSLIREKLETVQCKEGSDDSQECQFNNPQEYREPKCVSRLLRAQGNDEGMKSWLTEMSAELSRRMENLAKKKENVSKKLEEILRSIPSCVQVSFS